MPHLQNSDGYSVFWSGHCRSDCRVLLKCTGSRNGYGSDNATKQEYFLPQLPVISQSDWLVCRCRWESRQRCTRHARVILSRSVIANQERSFWEINQSYCEKVIDNACSFFESWFWSRSKIKTFFGVESTTFWPLWWRIPLSIRVQTTLNHFRFVKLLERGKIVALHVRHALWHISLLYSVKNKTREWNLRF